jgi:hypothetical protein
MVAAAILAAGRAIELSATARGYLLFTLTRY